jgi:WD40 repeat protein
VFALSLSSDGKTLASLDNGNAITLWDIATGEPEYAFGPIPHPMNDVRFSPDGSALASRGLGHAGRWIVYVWPAPRTE